ncbi:hypothetical protein [Bartonella tribocorum]|uniref:Uncharacterized protein n=1 Tax=Bartonella tribocorum TaxID=85701 RepID=A0A2N9Y8U5_9HYPH|nr:hypothetical protein [Bartonella tribocorum]PIT68128.1 hypothetical protein CER18_08185 [Bartonella tribocorum]
MIKDQSQQQSTYEGNEAFISQSVSDQWAAFKKGMALSTKDYVIICCLAIFLLVLFVATTYMQPWDFFHVISNEQFQEMGKKNFQEIIQESLQNPFKNSIIGYVRDAGWNSVWAFLCLMPQMIVGVLFAFFPFFFVLLAMVKRDVKQMLLLWETVSEPQQLDNQSFDRT